MRVLDLAEFYSERGGGVRSYPGNLVRSAGTLGHEVVVAATCDPSRTTVYTPATAHLAAGPAWGYLAWLTKHFDVTVTLGDWLAADLKQRGCQRVAAGDSGIDAEDFRPDRASPSTRRQLLGQLADAPDAKVLLIAGRNGDRQAAVEVASSLPQGSALAAVDTFGICSDCTNISYDINLLVGYCGLCAQVWRFQYTRRFTSVAYVRHSTTPTPPNSTVGIPPGIPIAPKQNSGRSGTGPRFK
jgi:hypothetical protein